MQIQRINSNSHYALSRNKAKKNICENTSSIKDNPSFTSKFKLPRDPDQTKGLCDIAKFLTVTTVVILGGWVNAIYDAFTNKEFVEQRLFNNNIPAEDLEAMGVTESQFNIVKQIITKQLKNNFLNDVDYFYKGFESSSTIRFTDGVESFDFIIDKKENFTEFSELNIPELEDFSVKVIKNNNDGFSITTDFADNSYTQNFTKDGMFIIDPSADSFVAKLESEKKRQNLQTKLEEKNELNVPPIISNSSTDKFVAMLELEQHRQDLQTKLGEKNKEYEMLSLALESMYGNEEANNKLYELIKEKNSDSENIGFGTTILGTLIGSGGNVWLAVPMMLGGMIIPELQVQNELEEMTKPEIKNEIIKKMNSLEQEISNLEMILKQ